MSYAAVSPSTSIWQTITCKTLFPHLTREIKVDVALMGGGITGLTAALLLI